ncbi:glycoside hydrolase superfamily [Chaetomium fimeti]|uniref:Glycoside hydrolase superfamily n=1 Tax=Chaetomium fimeti TaxID=1854472 RepID=A0AAE0LWR7_9PEZI|nr:glycoside hydrolase superfamily [Chaetomium fimeti]
MTAFIAAYPPLGQVTQVQDGNVTFHAVLEIPFELRAEPWQLALWYSNGDESEWIEAECIPTQPDARPTDLHEPVGTTARLYFTTKLVVHSSLTFTIKFRQQNHDKEWRWARDEQHSSDGVVVVNLKPTQDGDPESLPDLIRDLNPDLKWKSHMSQTPRTRLWSIEAGVEGAKEHESTFHQMPVGIPWGRFLRWFALVRTSTPWLAPRQGKSEFNPDKDALLCSFLSAQGKHMVFLGMSGINDVTTMFRGGDSGKLMLNIRSDNTKSTTGTALVAVGDDFESTIAAVMYHARTLVMGTSASATQGLVEATAEGDIVPQWYENWYDGLGYCTWNSLGQKLTEENILKALDTLAENRIKISNLIIDDNWQDVDYRGEGQWQHGWNDFEAEPKAFPRGLKALISDIRSKHKNIQYIAVWHALLGYWGGLSPSGPLTKRYNTIQVTRDDTEKSQLPVDNTMTVVSPSDIQTFYNDFYTFLSSCGINGVKTDAQYMLDTLPDPHTRRALTTPYLDAWAAASLRHFSGHVTSCMSQTPPTIFHSLLPNTRPAIPCRNSDDFFPGVPDAHPWHVFANAHNALFTQHLNVVPDWDMFQTAHHHHHHSSSSSSPFDNTPLETEEEKEEKEWATFHAAARCVGGGPVCVTDAPGRHDLALLRAVSGPTPRGRSVVFRPSVPGRAMDVYDEYRGGGDGAAAALLKVGAYHGRAGTGTGIVGVFNVRAAGGVVTEVLPLGRFPGVVGGVESGRRYVVRAHRSGRVTAPLEVGSPAAVLTVSLGVRGCDVLCAYPLHAVESKTRGEVLLANLGLVGKMTGCAAVLRTGFEVRENGRMVVDATVKALGVLGVYISVLPELSIDDDFMVTIQGLPIPPHTASVSKQDEHVLEADIEAAWNEMGLASGWANEVQVKVYFALEKRH